MEKVREKLAKFQAEIDEANDKVAELEDQLKVRLEFVCEWMYRKEWTGH